MFETILNFGFPCIRPCYHSPSHDFFQNHPIKADGPPCPPPKLKNEAPPLPLPLKSKAPFQEILQKLDFLTWSTQSL